jgi:hypothetical protein
MPAFQRRSGDAWGIHWGYYVGAEATGHASGAPFLEQLQIEQGKIYDNQ